MFFRFEKEKAEALAVHRVDPISGDKPCSGLHERDVRSIRFFADRIRGEFAFIAACLCPPEAPSDDDIGVFCTESDRARA